MEITFDCKWAGPKDQLNVFNIGNNLHFHTDGSDAVVLTINDAKRLRDELNIYLAEYAPKPVVEQQPKPQGYQSLTPLAQKLVRHMRRAGSISAREAMADHGISSASLARRIIDIEEAGFTVKRDRRVHPITGQRYTRYQLVEA